MDRGDLPVGRSRSCSAGCVGVHPPRTAEKSVPRLYSLAVRPADHAGVLLAAATDGIASGGRITDPKLTADTVLMPGRLAVISVGLLAASAAPALATRRSYGS